MRKMILYVDDSGTRHPDHQANLSIHERDWFALEGVIIYEAQVGNLKEKHRALCERWSIDGPLHSHKIRHKKEHFAWLRKDPRAKLFYEDIASLVADKNLTGIACVIDRPGYNARYREKYGDQRWMLCRTAFYILLERASRFAMEANCKLDIYIEKSDKKTDSTMRQYFMEAKNYGSPFKNDVGYKPLSASDFSDVLYDFRIKEKTSPLIQIADLCLWPIAMGGYDPNNVPYQHLRNAGQLIDCKVPSESIATCGIKYSCWELVQKKSPDESRL